MRFQTCRARNRSRRIQDNRGLAPTGGVEAQEKPAAVARALFRRCSSSSPSRCSWLKASGVSTIYLQFDGVTPELYLFSRGFNLLPIRLRAIQNLREAGSRSIVLIPVLINGVNDDQVGAEEPAALL